MNGSGGWSSLQGAFFDIKWCLRLNARAAPPAYAFEHQLVEKGIVPMNNVQLEEELVVYTVPEVAAILKVCQHTVYRMIERNQLKTCCLLRHKRVSKVELARFISATNGRYQ